MCTCVCRVLRVYVCVCMFVRLCGCVYGSTWVRGGNFCQQTINSNLHVCIYHLVYIYLVQEIVFEKLNLG